MWLRVYVVEAKREGRNRRGRVGESVRRSHRHRRLAAVERGELLRLSLYAPDDLRSLGLELGRVALVRFFLTLHDESRVSTDESPQRFSRPPSKQPELLRYSPSPTSHHWTAALSSSAAPDAGGEEQVGLVLTSSNPLHLWSSNSRCFAQKCPSQKPQSPTIRWAADLHSLKVQRGFWGAMLSDGMQSPLEKKLVVVVWEVR
ncbi:hypothetical protein F4818DRAFT_438395 [Hypoxylon cercidicola]|nr:hypothetical protein F4818DRAFT_438395 [Hypoxylon cercidicola]